MKKLSGKYKLVTFTACLFILLSPSTSRAGKLSEVSYLYRLSTFTGMAAVGAWPILRVDRTNNEIYVLTQDEIRIFNQNGMEVYQLSNLLDERGEEQTILDVAVKENGALIFLTQTSRKGRLVNELVVGNYRGEPISPLILKNLPPDLQGFQPDRIFYQAGLLYLANLSRMQIVIADPEGNCQRTCNIMPFLHQARKDEDRGKARRRSYVDEIELNMGDFSVDREGNILFTVPVVGNVYKLTPDFQLSLIGKRGGGPDKFGIPAAIITDDDGNYLVSDILQSVVKVFDKDMNFIGSFGGRHAGQDALFSPRGLAVDAKNRLYVSQTERAGVSVFQLIDH